MTSSSSLWSSPPSKCHSGIHEEERKWRDFMVLEIIFKANYNFCKKILYKNKTIKIVRWLFLLNAVEGYYGEGCLLDRSRLLFRNITGRKTELVDLHFLYTLHKYRFVGGMIRSLQEILNMHSYFEHLNRFYSEKRKHFIQRTISLASNCTLLAWWLNLTNWYYTLILSEFKLFLIERSLFIEANWISIVDTHLPAKVPA